MQLYRRKKIWWCRIRNRAGRIVRKTTKCRDYKAAVDVAAEFERSFAAEDHAAAEAATLEGCVADYLADLVRRGRAKATQEIGQQKTGHYLRLWGPTMPMARISARLVTEYIDKRLSEDASRFTVKKELDHLRQVLLIARHHGLFHLGVERVLPPYFSGGHKPKTRWPSLEEMRRLLDAMQPHRAAHLAFIAATGSRWSESLRARREDVQWDRLVVHIRGTKTAEAESEVPITPLTAKLLWWALENAPGKSVLFLRWGKYHRDIHAACVRAGIELLSPNDLRRAFGHWHRAAGVDVNAVSKMLRHTTDKLAQTTYAKLRGEEVSVLVNRTLAGVPIMYLGDASDDPKGP